MSSNRLILCHPLLLLPSIFPTIRIFTSESALRIRWPKYWSFSFSISPSNEYLGLISLGLTGLISLLSKGLSRVYSNTTIWKHQFFGTQPSLWSSSQIHTWYWKNHSFDYINLFGKVISLLFSTLSGFVSFPSKEQVSFYFVAAVNSQYTKN